MGASVSFNGSGTFSLASGNPVVTGTTISSTWCNNTLSDIASNGLTNCLTKDGQTTPSANIPLGGYKITNLGNGTATTDAAAFGQIQSGSSNVVTGVSGVTTITGSLSPSPGAYAEGLKVSATMLGANGAGATLNLNSIGAAPIYWNLAAVRASLWSTANAIDLVYMATSMSTASMTGFHVIGHSGFLPANLLSVKGSLLVGKGSGGVEVLSPGTDGQFLVATASASSGLGWSTQTIPAVATQAQVNGMTATGVYIDPSLNTIILSAEASATSAAVTFGSIPSGVRRISVLLKGISTNGTSNLLLQIGPAGGIVSTGYLAGAGNGGGGFTESTAGFIQTSSAMVAASTYHGRIALSLESTANNTWVSSGTLYAAGQVMQMTAGSISLSGELTQLKLTMVNGTDVFDAGAFAIQYER